ncbi:MAG TPA: tetratricopeptide repeat protein [Longimicrobium sp.]|nr:tetratricopeptide repeat protein [Longimicrobium sp.]
METLEKPRSPARKVPLDGWSIAAGGGASSVDDLNRIGRTMLDTAICARASHDGKAAMAGEDASSPGMRRPEREWLADAEQAFRQATAADASNVDLHRKLGLVLIHAGKCEEAIHTLNTAVRLAPDNADLSMLLADAQRTGGDYDAAVDTLQQFVAREPGNVHARLLLFAMLYIQGDHLRAWTEYECRVQAYSSDFPQPLWDGSPLDGRTILLDAEQGLGDQVQFIRYARLVKERGGRVVVKCSRNLYRLLLTCDGVDEVIPPGEELPPFDCRIWLLSLPHVLGTTQDSVPARVPYVHADPHQVERWQGILGRFPGLRIGIHWAGNLENRAGLDRQLPLSCFFPLARIPGVQLFSLQKGAGADALDERPEDLSLPSLGPYFKDLQDTAAAVTALDLVITNDTSIAHLVGALGKPVWVVLPRQECWRWQRDRDDCLWYPTMRLFRRGWNASWDETFAGVDAALRDVLAGRAAMHAGVDA